MQLNCTLFVPQLLLFRTTEFRSFWKSIHYTAFLNRLVDIFISTQAPKSQKYNVNRFRGNATMLIPDEKTWCTQFISLDFFRLHDFTETRNDAIPTLKIGDSLDSADAN